MRALIVCVCERDVHFVRSVLEGQVWVWVDQLENAYPWKERVL